MARTWALASRLAGLPGQSNFPTIAVGVHRNNAKNYAELISRKYNPTLMVII
jgi:hypothetical protein